jgi:hypothetical protein
MTESLVRSSRAALLSFLSGCSGAARAHVCLFAWQRGEAPMWFACCYAPPSSSFSSSLSLSLCLPLTQEDASRATIIEAFIPLFASTAER